MCLWSYTIGTLKYSVKNTQEEAQYTSGLDNLGTSTISEYRPRYITMDFRTPGEREAYKSFSKENIAIL